MNSITTPTTLEKIQRRLAESRFFAFSLLLHTALVIVASTIMLIRYNMEEEIIPTGGVEVPQETRDPDPVAMDKPNEFNPETSRMAGPSGGGAFNPTLPGYDADNIRLDVKLPIHLPVITTKFPTAVRVAFQSGGKTGDVPKSMAARFLHDGNGRILGGYGGVGTGGRGPTIRSENAIIRGLKWLRDHQNKDGSWGDKNHGAMTGLALLSFLGHGELGDSPEFGYAVNKAVEWVISNGTQHQGRLSMTDNGWGGNGGVYEHAILTYALGEYYTMSKDERAVELFRKAISYIVEGQGQDGGWMYNFDKTASDTSVSGWQVQALKAAHLSELRLPGVREALDRSMKNFDRVQGPNGGYGYRGAEDRYSLTGVGVLCKMFWGEKRDENVKRAVEFISVKTARELPFQYQHERADLYAWYYHTQAMCMFGGTAWTEWNDKFNKEITNAQSPDGSWPAMRAPGHGNLQGEAALTGAVYRTTLSILMLEVYYRYLPTNRAFITGDTSKLARL